MFPPTVKLSICCRSRNATWALAPLFVTKMHGTNALIFNHTGDENSKTTHATVCTTIIMTMEQLRVKKGIWLTMNPTEHTGWMIVEVGRMMQAQISAVTIARAMAPFPKRRNTEYALPTSGSSNMSPVKIFIPLKEKRAPGLTICVHANNNATQTVIRMKMPFKINLNRLSCSI